MREFQKLMDLAMVRQTHLNFEQEAAEITETVNADDGGRGSEFLTTDVSDCNDLSSIEAGNSLFTEGIEGNEGCSRSSSVMS